MSYEPKDRDLVRRARGGDRDSFGALVERHASLLRRACRRGAGGDHGLADDAVQEAVLTAMLSLDRLRNDDAFGPWLAGIGLNATRHLLRDRHAHAPLDGADEPTAPEDPGADLDAARTATRIRRAIATLPAGQRDAVALFYLAGLTQAEAAEHLGVPPTAVKARLHKARTTLRRRLEPLWKEQFAMSEFVTMRVTDVRRGAQGARHVVLLQEHEGSKRRLPIWVGPTEAIAIAGLLEGVELPRPSTHDFAAALVGAAGTTVREVRINRLAEATFYADVLLTNGGTVDARPSDAITLALTMDAPIAVDADILDRSRAAEAAYADEIGAFEESTDDRRTLAAETRERIRRQAAEVKAMASRTERG